MYKEDLIEKRQFIIQEVFENDEWHIIFDNGEDRIKFNSTQFPFMIKDILKRDADNIISRNADGDITGEEWIIE